MNEGSYSRGYLPHWREKDGLYFVTFRLEDTLPQEVLREYQASRDDLIRKSKGQGTGLTWAERKRLHELYSERIESYLDAGYGECWLEHEGVAELVCGALRFFNGQRYQLGDWVVMPNHVHVLVQPLGEHELSAILQSWKGFSGRESNRILDRVGQPFWQREYYNHLVREDDEAARLANYIRYNPVAAGLCATPEQWRWSSADR